MWVIFINLVPNSSITIALSWIKQNMVRGWFAAIVPVATQPRSGELCFLLGQERWGDDKQKWGELGGSVEKNETFQQAALREAREESLGLVDGPALVSALQDAPVSEFSNGKVWWVDVPYDPLIHIKFLKLFTEHGCTDAGSSAPTCEMSRLRWFSESHLRKLCGSRNPRLRGRLIRTLHSRFGHTVQI